MSEMKLTYFNVRGRAETIRMLFKLAGKPFIDCRVSKEEWIELKPKTPKGQLPILEFDGKVLCESLAIARYVARETGLYGADNWESAICDMVGDGVTEVATILMQYKYKAKTEDEKAEVLKQIQTAVEVFEKFVAKLKKGQYILGAKVSMADVAVHNLVELGSMVTPEFFGDDKTPTLMELVKIFEKIPAIAEWLKTRPQTEL